jgi:hypothetical protein
MVFDPGQDFCPSIIFLSEAVTARQCERSSIWVVSCLTQRYQSWLENFAKVKQSHTLQQIVNYAIKEFYTSGNLQHHFMKVGSHLLKYTFAKFFEKLSEKATDDRQYCACLGHLRW